MRSPCLRSRSPFMARAAIGLACILLAAGARGEARDDAVPARQRAVYVCQDGGIPMYADRPCGSTIHSRTLVVDPPRAGEPVSLTPREPRAATRPRRLPVVEPGRPGDAAAANDCAALQRQLATLDERMRAGYSAREAARLWQRWRDLRERLRAARC